jgi:hypothetical protein
MSLASGGDCPEFQGYQYRTISMIFVVNRISYTKKEPFSVSRLCYGLPRSFHLPTGKHFTRV